MLMSRLSPAFADIGSALDGLNQFRDTPFGTVRINAPSSLAPFVLGPVLGSLVATNPNLQIEIVATDRLIDIVEEGFDAGIRLGQSLREGMTAVRIKPRVRLAVVGAPAYLKKHPPPRTPADLARHVCIQNLYPSGVRYPWSFEKDGRAIDFQPTGPLSSDDHDIIVRAAIDGVGLGYVWEGRAEAAVADGRLVRVLEPWCPLEEWLYLYYPTRKYLAGSLRAVIEALRAR
jgi:DNA-binding transcriptional LysR family regulator